MKERNQTIVLGAGIVGVTCALELQRRGARVTLIDRREPGRETSYGNAGVFATSSLIPFNNPNLFRSLPAILQNQGVSVRYDPAYLLRELPWAARFLANARKPKFDATAAALQQLILLSADEHVRLLGEAGALHRLRHTGWMFLYRHSAGFATSALGRRTFDAFDVSYQVLGRADIHALEPHLAQVYEHAVLMDKSMSVDSPGGVVQAYADLFVARGGKLLQTDVTALTRHDVPAGAENGAQAWRVHHTQGTDVKADDVVVALGPWSKQLLAPLGLPIPMAFERGYHMHYAPAGEARLNRPVYDTAGGFVLTPMEQGIRLATGVELNALNAAPVETQWQLSEVAARTVFPLGDRLEAKPWLGRRPTLPDSRPMIGPVPSHRGLWLAFGHQHIGFNTSAGTAALLGAMMAGETPAFDPQPFAPARYLRH